MIEWIKALHVISVIAWMAGMLYLPRLFVYHCEAEPGSKQSETFKVMERRLLAVIINPAMVASWALGLWLAWDGGWYAAGWLQAKVMLVLLLSAAHGFLARCVRLFGLHRRAPYHGAFAGRGPSRYDAVLHSVLSYACPCPCPYTISEVG